MSSIPDYTNLLKDVRSVFDSRLTRPVDFRVAQLQAFLRLLDENKCDIIETVGKELGRSVFESDIADIIHVRNEVVDALNNISSWMKPEKVSPGLHNIGNAAFRKQEPLGVVLIIGTWNYPYDTTLSPLVGAIAAGCCAVIKPSEVSPHSSAHMARLLPKYLDPRCYRVVEGAVPETTALLQQKFDHIFYTGNGTVGRIIMSAASKHLTPLTLELGGKSPVIIDGTNDLDVVSRRLIFAKLFNNGQTCIGPDYVLIQRDQTEHLLSAIRKAYQELYGGDSLKSPDCGRIINERHFLRLKNLKDSCSGKIVIGGAEDGDNLELTVFLGVDPSDKIMQDEIFGPLLPIIEVDSVEEAVRFVNARPKPLSAYLFSRDKGTQNLVVEEIACGGMNINDIMLHCHVSGLPFGGVGNSGIGQYHGKASFDTFSHFKSVLVCNQGMEFLFKLLRYPPYNEAKRQRVNWLLKKWIRSPLIAYLPWVLMIGLAAILVQKWS